MRISTKVLAAGLGAAVLLAVATLGGGARGTAQGATPPIALPSHDPCPDGKASKPPPALTLPAIVPPGDPIAIEKTMLDYLATFHYRTLGWCVDKYVRDTGPYIHGFYYGTHPAVRIYYSPEIMDWLRNGRKGEPADGAVMIKEQYSPTPAARYVGLRDDQLKPDDWTVMIRRKSASRDGWFWSEVYVGMNLKNPPDTQYPNAGFGLYCLRCHASAEKLTTFAALNNIKGFPGEPLVFRVDSSWRTPQPGAVVKAVVTQTAPAPDKDPEHEKNRLEQMAVAHKLAGIAIQTFPPEPLDGNLSNPSPQPPPEFITSSQCLSCHSGASVPSAFGPVMWLTPPPNYTPPPSPLPGANGVNVSEYGEWRWSPMGLAGRDPVFYSQIESELAYIQSIPDDRILGDKPRQTRNTLEQQVVDTCLRCHGVMGKRTNDIELRNPDAHFNLQWIFNDRPTTRQFHLGGLARDGISCTVCHHIVQTKEQADSLAYVLKNNSTGLFTVGEPEKLHGPFKDDVIVTHPMIESLGTKPVFSDLTKSARLCTTCHSINLPIVDEPKKIHPIIPEMPHSVEQNTYVEWVNSRYQTEYKPLPGAKSCQDCHMPPSVDNDRLGVHVNPIQTQIATVQDQYYPQAEERAPIDQITVQYRQHGFRRHEFLGLNAFLLRTFQQNSNALGVRLLDYMTNSNYDLPDAIGNVVHSAQHATAKVDVTASFPNGELDATVGVLNETGHRFPSGVGFRRAWLELKVVDNAGNVIFASGTTNEKGEIVNGTTTNVLATEHFAPAGPGGTQVYQVHRDEAHPITSGDQVQIFEELEKDADNKFTFSFIRRDHEVKENRLLPQGWSEQGPPGIPLPPNWIKATEPHGVNVDTDPNYHNGKGRAVVAYRVPLHTALDPSQLHVEVTLWDQSWEPDFLTQRTRGGVAAARLKALLANDQLEQTPLTNWKLKIASACAPAANCPKT
ncbi:MAG: hypothetical protein JOZ86_13440 [Candidatus Eremiobacteraeota bacterium]|nr:hypothetical protein [Candidatus Eremiobacteraeota bacterium]